jgi:hypothetical protein
VANLSDLPPPESLARSYGVPRVTVLAGMSRCGAALALDPRALLGRGPAMTVLAAAGMCRRLAEMSGSAAEKAAARERGEVFLAASRRVLADGPPALDAEVAAEARKLLGQLPPSALQGVFPWERGANTRPDPVAASFPSAVKPAMPGSSRSARAAVSAPARKPARARRI